MRILVVDDNPIVRHIHLHALRHLAYIESVDNAELAIRYHQEQPYEVILLDIHLPGMNGLEAAKTIRAQDNHVIIWGVTGRLDSKTKQACLTAGMNELFIKPVPLHDLRSAVLKIRYKEC